MGARKVVNFTNSFLGCIFRTFLPECSLPFLPRPLDEIVFEVLGEPRESAGHRWLMPSGIADIQANENAVYGYTAFESAA